MYTIIKFLKNLNIMKQKYLKNPLENFKIIIYYKEYFK